MKHITADAIVVGSGPSAVHAAYPIVQSGLSVVMLDVGNRDTTYASLIPNRPFAEIRWTDPLQHRYFLGDRFEGISLNRLGVGPQITPPRQHVVQDAQALSPVDSPTFHALQSFAVGGLGGVWGAVSFPFLDNELAKAGLSPSEMHKQYEIIASRIGISGCQDDLTSLCGTVPLLPPLDIDHHSEMIFSRYERKRGIFQRAGLYMGRPVMSVLTQPLNGRTPNPYHDMDFWSNPGGNIYSPVSTLLDLEEFPKFSYRRSYFVEGFQEEGETVSIFAKSLETGEKDVFVARRLIIAAGALGTARIALRSLGQYDVCVPLTCNMHFYVPCLHYSSLGKPPKDRCHSLAQLTVIYDPTRDHEHLVQAQLYSYRSLLMFKLLQESPLPLRESLRAIRSLSNSMLVVVIQFEDNQSSTNHCTLRRGQGQSRDYLQIAYEPSDAALRDTKQTLKVLKRFMRNLGCLPLRTVEPGHGSSVHYGSLLPFSIEEKPLTTEPSGRLRGTHGVYVADGAAFSYLPAKGLTLTLMANANRIGQNVVRDLHMESTG
jgi:hypothetical protein